MTEHLQVTLVFNEKENQTIKKEPNGSFFIVYYLAK